MMKTVLELHLECGHKIQTLHLTKSEKETQTTICPLEQLVKPTRIMIDYVGLAFCILTIEGENNEA